jgi:hypothetical protein
MNLDDMGVGSLQQASGTNFRNMAAHFRAILLATRWRQILQF